ncbi:MAG: hypothetical protein ACRDY0_10545 [Acidimicrobiales bacterium]
MPSLDDLLPHVAAHAVLGHQRGVTVQSVTMMAGAGPDDWAGVVEPEGSDGMTRAVVALAGPAMDALRAGGSEAAKVSDWDADRLKALRAVSGDTALLAQAEGAAGEEVAGSRSRIERLAEALRAHVGDAGTDLLGRCRLEGADLAKALAAGG